eukprot:gnl/Dysnectes_brevis/262_a293_4957.p1 GENE.gnl/Dysnectes_brevis/262_a293_4957~~gnl/Dysnectes_brevis/262_a293_4957.p1  ORF type:complete len:299 (+),score=72.25 gnl/Dysnectes_brevis/262_a293_4957:34-930(+)
MSHKMTTDASGKHTWAKHRVLTIHSKLSTKQRELKQDLERLMPHHKRESRFESSDSIVDICELAEHRKCDTIAYFEGRHHEMFLWLAAMPAGPTIRFHVHEIATTKDLSFQGNHRIGTRPLLSFDSGFDGEAVPRVCKELLKRTFATPCRHHKSAPFVDHVMQFGLLKDLIPIRSFGFDIKTAGRQQAPELLEAGPRFTLQPLMVLREALRGKAIWRNPGYVGKTEQLATERAQAASRLRAKREHKDTVMQRDLSLPVNPIDGILSGAAFSAMQAAEEYLGEEGSDIAEEASEGPVEE